MKMYEGVEIQLLNTRKAVNVQKLTVPRLVKKFLEF
jgi:hypothetical protein